ncbi:MAG: hypothetical protein HXX18_13090 [Bacteroidetes bacterium]|nr:hypothetical protein [Bacteroidota bacterium]
MKKSLILISIVLFTVFSVSAQTLVSKKGIPILPQKGDFAIGVAATPFLDFFGNIAKINSGSAFSSSAAFNALTPNVIYGKYFLTDNMAVRGKIRIGKNSTTKTQSDVIKSNLTVPTTPEYVEDKWTHSTTDIVLSAGLEKRRGYGRLQGFYGAEATISLQGGSKDSYEYGNAITKDFTSPARHDFGSNNYGGGAWVTESSTGTLFGIGVGAFVGVEYFFAPKMSVGGEFGWGIGINQGSNVSGSTEKIVEGWDGTAVKSVTIPGSKTSSFNIDTKQTGGNIFLLFHF